ncbi:tRNA (cytosine-5-)-methyltransferase ncl1 [Cryptotrichosporon argae]
MGRPKRGGRGGGRGGGRQAEPARQAVWKSFEPADMRNAAFETYYKAQGVVSEAEWDSFLAILKTELPTTFRVTGSRAHAEVINEQIRDNYVPTMQDVDIDGVKYGPPHPISWYPEQLAWQVDAPKRTIRKSPPYKAFQRFLVGETEVGNLSRQEAVSMIPPLLLDVQPHHKCLDMCAAPGSKTAQIIEALNPHHTESTGLIIANDADYKRTHMLVHQTGRMPSKGLVVTNYDASQFPNISLGDKGQLRFDRILADVPCSGDGTLRKNIEVWAKWGASDGNNLHALQLRILDRAMALLAPGGRLVYSTCSFNPAENEAVVAAALNAHPGEYTIVDAAGLLPALKRRPGITAWKVASAVTKDKPKPTRRWGRKNEDEGVESKDAEGAGEARAEIDAEAGTETKADDDAAGNVVFHESYDDYRAKLASGAFREKSRVGLAKTLWAPENANELGLEKCLRLLPHDQNTGGFFVCVLQKAERVDEAAKAHAPAVDIAALPEPDLSDVAVLDESGRAGAKRALSPSPSKEEAATKKAKAEGGGEGEVMTEAEGEVAPAEVKEDDAGKGKASETEKPAQQQGKKVKRDTTFKEDPFAFVDPAHEEVQKVIDWFGFKESFPRDELLVRNENGLPLRTVYFANDYVKRIIQNNDYSRLRIISAGVKALVRQDATARTDIACKWRISADGIDECLRHLEDGRGKFVEAGVKDLRVFVHDMYPSIDSFDEGPLKTYLEAAGMGNHLVRFAAGEDAGGKLVLPLILPVWRSRATASLLIDKREKSVLSLRVFGEDIVRPAPPIQHNKAAAEGSAPAGDGPVKDEEDALNADHHYPHASEDGLNVVVILKYVIVGDSAVGKSSLLVRLTDGRFGETEPTLGVEFGSRIIDAGAGRRVKVQCWDTAGTESFRSITRSYFRGAAGALLVYDVTRRDSFEHVTSWLSDLRQYADEHVSVILVANKTDLCSSTPPDLEQLRPAMPTTSTDLAAAERPDPSADAGVGIAADEDASARCAAPPPPLTDPADLRPRAVSTLEGGLFAKHHGLLYVETSARAGWGVVEAFEWTARDVLARVDAGALGRNRPGVSLNKDERRGGCC